MIVLINCTNHNLVGHIKNQMWQWCEYGLNYAKGVSNLKYLYKRTDSHWHDKMSLKEFPSK